MIADTLRRSGAQAQGPDHADTPGSDPLTGLGNHGRFMERLARMAASSGEAFSVAVIDIRGFRPINDLFGSEAGDIVLTQIAARLDTALGADAFAARVCADVFGLILPGIDTEDEARAFAEVMAELLAAPYDLGGRIANLSACIGVTVSQPGKAAATLAHEAFAALAAAKRAGYGVTVVFSPKIEEAMMRLQAIGRRLPRAIANEEIDVHFQPIICMRRGGLGGFEALARWRDAELGPVSPAEFIEIAETNGMISQLFRIVIDKALTAARQWPDDLFLAVNLSPSQMVDANTARVIIDALDRFGVAPERLEIEITESAVIANRLTAERIIADLKGAGIRLSLDDFGTGQSSLNRLRQLPFDKLKIDRSFVSSLENDRAAQTIVKSVLDMCNGLGIRVIAEGVETAEQAARLYMLGCKGLQGYLFGKPADAEHTLALIARNRPATVRTARDGLAA